MGPPVHFDSGMAHTDAVSGRRRCGLLMISESEQSKAQINSRIQVDRGLSHFRFRFFQRNPILSVNPIRRDAKTYGDAGTSHARTSRTCPGVWCAFYDSC